MLSRIEQGLIEQGWDIAIERDDKNEREALKLLKNHFSISRIYYPGCDIDRQLENTFLREEITYLDWDKALTKHPEVVIADMAHAPFPDAYFDSVFLRDLSTSPEELDDTMRVLKIGGIVIFKESECCDQVVDDLNFRDDLRALPLLYLSSKISVFQKIIPRELPDV